jgi:hypothetical protein
MYSHLFHDYSCITDASAGDSKMSKLRFVSLGSKWMLYVIFCRHVQIRTPEFSSLRDRRLIEGTCLLMDKAQIAICPLLLR